MAGHFLIHTFYFLRFIYIFIYLCYHIYNLLFLFCEETIKQTASAAIGVSFKRAQKLHSKSAEQTYSFLFWLRQTGQFMERNITNKDTTSLLYQ